MVFDSKTLDSFSALAGVIGEYTSPGRSRVELTSRQKQDGCMLRFDKGWHVHHIIEALGIADANYSHNWEDNMMEALEECALSDYWNTVGVRLSPGAQISVAGTNQYGAARQSALRDAMARILIADPYARTAPRKDKDGNILSRGLMERAFTLIDRQIEQKTYKNARPKPPGRQNLNRYIRDMEELGFVWKGAGRTQIMADIPEDTRILIDEEIKRQCRLQLAEGATITRGETVREAPLNYSAIARDVYSNFVFDEKLGDTMESMGWPAIQPGYVRQTCQDAEITVDVRRPEKEQIADEANIKLVKDERERDPTSTAWQIHQRTGLRLPIVEGILDAQGLPRAGRAYTTTQIRRIILKAHDDEKLTIQGMLEKHPELATYFKDNVLGAVEAIQGILRRADKTPLTEEIILAEETAERITPKIASIIKADLIAMLKDMQDQRFFGERLLIKIPDIAELSEALRQPESIVSEAIDMLLNEANPIINQAGRDIIVPAHIQARIKRGEISRWAYSAN